MGIKKLAEGFKKEMASIDKGKKQVLRDLDFWCLDNSIRESTVGQLKSHTIENKKEILAAVKRCGFKDIIVCSFNNMTRIDDAFAQWLKDTSTPEDFKGYFSFSEISNTVKDGRYDTEDIPVSLVKNKKFGLYNTFFEVDLNDTSVAWGTKWTIEDTCNLTLKWMNWVYDNINPKARILVNLRDVSDCLEKFPERVLHYVKFLARLPKDKRMFCIAYEDPLGEFLPEEVGAWTRTLRRIMDENDWKDGRLICHIHEKWGFENASQLEALASGGDGIWASLCEEGAAMGHACSSVTITNMVRLGNKSVLTKYNCKEVREAAALVTSITTTKPPHPKQVVYGERALDLVFGFLGTGSFDLATFFGAKRTNRMTTLAAPFMIRDHLISYFGENEQFTLELAQKMKELMLLDLHANRKEEYQSSVGIALLFDRAGGNLVGAMAEAVAKETLEDSHHRLLIAEVKAIWDEWDVKDGRADDDCLEFDFFYHAFAAPYLGCYRCTRTKQAFSCIDMDNNGNVHWNEFSLYLKWALRQYPEICSMEELLSVAFQKGLLPAMQDEMIRKNGLDAEFDEDEKVTA